MHRHHPSLCPFVFYVPEALPHQGFEREAAVQQSSLLSLNGLISLRSLDCGQGTHVLAVHLVTGSHRRRATNSSGFLASTLHVERYPALTLGLV
jgi:hypothetical protein